VKHNKKQLLNKLLTEETFSVIKTSVFGNFSMSVFCLMDLVYISLVKISTFIFKK